MKNEAIDELIFEFIFNLFSTMNDVWRICTYSFMGFSFIVYIWG